MNQIVVLPTVPIKHPPTSIFWPTAGCAPRTRFADDDEMKQSLREELRRFSTEFHATDIQRFTQRWKVVLIMKQAL